MLNHRRLFPTLLLMISSAVTHAQCFQPSPNLAAMGDSYYRQMQELQWSSKETKQKDELLDATEGRWKGDYLESECMGGKSNPRETLKIATVKAEFQNVMKGTLKMSVWKHFTSEKKKESDVVEMFDDRHLFAGNISQNGIKTAEIHSARLGGGGQRMDEIITQLDINGKQLTLTRSIYYNGYLGRVERYNLMRD